VNNIKVDVKGIGCEFPDSIRLAEEGPVVISLKTAVKHRIPK
jgi:hypothetical protein